MKLATKLPLIGAGAIALSTLTCLSIGVWQISSVTARGHDALRGLASSGLDNLSRGTYDKVRCQADSVRNQVDHNLIVAQHVMNEAGTTNQSGRISWRAVNQFTKAPTAIALPCVSIGGRALSGNRDPDAPSPVVDEVSGMVGGVATIFQRMNERGDMLRVATTVLGKNGKRAVGTYIPAVNPDGKPNRVVEALLSGETYRGVAYVVDRLYVAAYAPLRDSSGRVAGAIFVGLKQENTTSLRETIQSAKVGETGDICVIGATGDARGRYIISKGSARDGEDIWGVRDASGGFLTREVVSRALKLKPGEVRDYRYPAKDRDGATRTKIAAIAYYQPWDWVIVSSCYEDEMLTGAENMRRFGVMTLWVLAIAGIAAAVVAGLIFRWYSGSISRRIAAITGIAQTMATGDVGQAGAMIEQASEREAHSGSVVR